MSDNPDFTQLIPTYPFQHSDDVSGIIEGSDIFPALAVYNSHRLQAHTLHRHLWCEQKAVVQVVEELVSVRKGCKQGCL